MQQFSPGFHTEPSPEKEITSWLDLLISSYIDDVPSGIFGLSSLLDRLYEISFSQVTMDIFPQLRKHTFVLLPMLTNQRASWRVSLVEQRLLTLPEHVNLPYFSRVGVTIFPVLCFVCFSFLLCWPWTRQSFCVFCFVCFSFLFCRLLSRQPFCVFLFYFIVGRGLWRFFVFSLGIFKLLLNPART